MFNALCFTKIKLKVIKMFNILFYRNKTKDYLMLNLICFTKKNKLRWFLAFNYMVAMIWMDAMWCKR